MKYIWSCPRWCSIHFSFAIGFSIFKQLQEEVNVYTQELKMNFIKKGVGDFLYAIPNVLHKGKRTVVADCSIKDVNGNLVAQALDTFHITGRL
ncbi:PaaI family thioesterase [Virgibacillus byunsanensis]|uniref:PaaI family thioesterase n=1 Tax=Virgibacillus byunsanensis TaxID=570945 RepID=A0ABW3LG27_9BACI